MDQLLYWLDRGGWIAALQHAWIWASLTVVLAAVTVFGVAALARRYDGELASEDSEASA
ncbi:MAG TPA: hypothetical protein VFB32_15275 [Rudaea sp.]|nr:hypothetical protein [Rudaea sp.]